MNALQEIITVNISNLSISFIQNYRRLFLFIF